MALELGRFGRDIRNALEVLRFGVGEAWRRSYALIA
jgi:hypothetical protein